MLFCKYRDHAGFEKLQLQQEAEQQDKAKQKNYKLQHNNNNITTSDKVTNLHSYKPINCYSNNSGSSIQLSRNNNNGRTRNSYSLYKQLLTAQHEQKVQQMQKQMNQYSDITHTDNDIQQNINEGKRQNSKHYNRSLYRPYSANQNSKLTNAPRMSTRTIQQQQQQRSNSNNNNNNTTTSVFVYKPRIPILSIKIKINQNFTMFDIYNDTDIQKQCSELCNNMGQPGMYNTLYCNRYTYAYYLVYTNILLIYAYKLFCIIDKIRALYNFVIEKLEAANITQQQQQEQN